MREFSFRNGAGEGESEEMVILVVSMMVTVPWAGERLTSSVDSRVTEKVSLLSRMSSWRMDIDTHCESVDRSNNRVSATEP